MTGEGAIDDDASLAQAMAVLGGEPALLDLPFDGGGAHAEVHATGLGNGALDGLARAAGASLAGAYLAHLALLASVYSGAGSVVVAVHPPSARDAERAHLARVVVDYARSPVALVVEAERALAEARRLPPVDLGRLAAACEASAGTPVSVHLYEGEVVRGGAAVALALAPSGATLALDGRRLSAAMAGRIARTARHLLALFADAHRADVPLAELALTAEDECAELLGPFNDTAFVADGIDAETTLVDLFARAVAAHPERRAVVVGGSALTYRELDRATAAFASRLVDAGVGVGDRVALLLERSLETIVGMLGALRAGATYVPIDEGTPAARRESLLADSGARCLVTRAPLESSIPNVTLAASALAREELAPKVRVRASDGAYLIYTSGTTGTPKGVLVEHRSVVQYVAWFRHRYRVDERDVAALLTSYAFDLGYTTLWTTVLTGGELHLLPFGVREDPAAVARYFAAHRVSFVKLTPSLLGALLASPELEASGARALRLVVTGGERVRPHDVATLYARFPDVLLVNHYGPTETTIGVLTTPVAREALPSFAARPVLGRPIGNAKVYVTRDGRQLLPVGAPGELLIGGLAVARGYHARPELTRERFVDDPFTPGGRAYRSGDLARFTTGGAVEFLGRVDRQLKVRGYRVEPGEVEHAIVAQCGVREVVVEGRLLGESNRVLVAYFVGPSRVVGRAAMREALGAVLPEYAIPSYFVEVGAIPRNENGKLDVKRLPEPAPEPEAGPSDAATTETERALVRMWASALGAPAASIGVTQNFFDLGGHSLLMIQLLAEIASELGATLEIQVFYDEGTIRAIAAEIDAQKGSA